MKFKFLVEVPFTAFVSGEVEVDMTEAAVEMGEDGEEVDVDELRFMAEKAAIDEFNPSIDEWAGGGIGASDRDHRVSTSWPDSAKWDAAGVIKIEDKE